MHAREPSGSQRGELASRAAATKAVPVSFDVRTAGPDDHEGIQALVRHAFFADLSAPGPEPAAPTVPDERRLVAVDGRDRVVGHLGVWELGHWLHGRRVPTGGVSAVVVDPTWRGRGVGSALLREGLEAMAARHEQLATLFALTRGVYRRHGFEVAGERPGLRLATAALLELPSPPDVELAPATPDDVPAMAALEARLARDEHGMLARTESFARRALQVDGEHAAFLARRDGRLVGHVVLAHRRGREQDELFRLEARELVAADEAAHRALLLLLGGHASGARTVELIARPEPLELLLPERALHADPGSWRWMCRAVDLAGAVGSRGWPATARVEVDLDVADATLPANAGRWHLSVADGVGHLERGGSGRVRIDVGALTSLLTGWATPAVLRAAGRVDGATSADLEALTTATAGPTPWVRDFF
jgi:predicted acetyltransferase